LHSLKHYYHEFNSRYFRGRLPKDCRVIWADINHQKCPEAMGVFKPGITVLARRVRRAKKGEYRTLYSKKDLIAIDRELFKVGNKIVFMTLIHEMVHLKLKDVTAGHGPLFQKEMKKLAARGAFNNFW
jgi:hypothetical protein